MSVSAHLSSANRDNLIRPKCRFEWTLDPIDHPGKLSKWKLIRTNWRDPIWWRDVAISKIVLPLMEARNDGTYLLDEAWNNLIILDACRYDTFERAMTKWRLPGKLERRNSRATDTGEFLIKNFSKRNYDDVVYVSANPFTDKFIKNKVHKLISVWRTHWDEEHDTVLPQVMYDCTLEAAKIYPDKRIISHFVQPHYPYIGYSSLNVSKFLSAKPEKKQVKGRGYKDTSFFTLSAKLIYANAIRERNEHLEAYSQNLNLALFHVERLIKLLPGKTVVTADHGEAFGEKISRLIPIRVYGHMPRMRIESLTRVPWLTIEPQEKIAATQSQVA